MPDNILFRLFRSRFPADPNATVLGYACGSTSFADLDDQSTRLCQTLKANGITKGNPSQRV